MKKKAESQRKMLRHYSLCKYNKPEFKKIIKAKGRRECVNPFINGCLLFNLTKISIIWVILSSLKFDVSI